MRLEERVTVQGPVKEQQPDGMSHRGGGGGAALEGKGPQGCPQQRVDRRLEEVAKAVGGGYCRLQMPFSPARAVRGTVAGRRLGALDGWGVNLPPPFQCIPGWGGLFQRRLVDPWNRLSLLPQLAGPLPHALWRRPRDSRQTCPDHFQSRSWFAPSLPPSLPPQASAPSHICSLAVLCHSPSHGHRDPRQVVQQ